MLLKIREFPVSDRNAWISPISEDPRLFVVANLHVRQKKIENLAQGVAFDFHAEMVGVV